MAEHITRDAALRVIAGQRGPTRSPAQNRMLDLLGAAILSLPAADAAAEQRGQWNGEGDGYADGEFVIDVWHCSNCDYCIDDGTDDPELLPKYCPGCGARMDGEN